MSDALVSRLGQQDGAGDADALFLKRFGGEVLAAFEERNRFMPRHIIRSIDSGKSASFPAIWKANAQYHTPGTEITGQVINHNERVITIDDVLIADAFVSQIDELKNHYDIRSEYARQLAAALSRQFDKNVAQLGLLAARASATVSGGNGGTAITDADADTNGDSLVASIYEAAEALDEKDVPEGDRFCFVLPDQYYQLVLSDKVIQKEYIANPAGVGIDTGKIYMVGGFELVMSNNVPSSNIASGPSAYQGDFSTSVSVCMHRSAVGTVKLMDLGVEAGWDMRRQGTLMLAKYAVGHGILRPEASVEIKTS